MAEKRKSLMDGLPDGAPAAKPSSKGGGMSSDTLKLLVAVGIFVVAGVIYLVSTGMFSKPSKGVQADPEVVEAFQKQKVANETAAKATKPPPQGAD